MFKRIVVFIMVFGSVLFGLNSGVRVNNTLPSSTVVAAQETEEKVTDITELVETHPVVQHTLKTENLEVIESDIENEDTRPTLEEVLYHIWEASTDDAFEYEVYKEEIAEDMLAGAEDYIIDRYEFDEFGNFILYWTTDYMTARLVAYADKDYCYMEANYFVDECGAYVGDTLYFRR